MITAPIPADEPERLADLYRHQVLDTPREEEFDDLVVLASRICNVPISLISLIDANRQWFKAQTGLDITETHRDVSFCSHAIHSDEIFVVPDALHDKRFSDNPLVTGTPAIRFYAGVPLKSHAGYKLGTLCIIDRVPRELSSDQQDALRTLGKQVCKQLELKVRNIELERISESQRRIISVMAHDVRSPLSSLYNLLGLYQNQAIEAKRFDEFLQLANNQLNSTLNLLENMVEWGKIHLHQLAANMEIISLCDQVQIVCNELATQALLKENKLTNYVAHSLRLTADPHIIRFIVRNLVSNALKFTEKGSITISAEVTGKQVHIIIQDTGIGMSQQITETLLLGNKKYLRKGTRNETGSGPGLSLVQEFVEKLNGSVKVESTEGKGTRFVVMLEC